MTSHDKIRDDHDPSTELGVVLSVSKDDDTPQTMIDDVVFQAAVVPVTPPRGDVIRERPHHQVKFLSEMFRNSSEKSSISDAKPFTRFVKWL